MTCGGTSLSNMEAIWYDIFYTWRTGIQKFLRFQKTIISIIINDYDRLIFLYWLKWLEASSIDICKKNDNNFSAKDSRNKRIGQLLGLWYFWLSMEFALPPVWLLRSSNLFKYSNILHPKSISRKNRISIVDGRIDIGRMLATDHFIRVW